MMVKRFLSLLGLRPLKPLVSAGVPLVKSSRRSEVPVVDQVDSGRSGVYSLYRPCDFLHAGLFVFLRRFWRVAAAMLFTAPRWLDLLALSASRELTERQRCRFWYSATFDPLCSSQRLYAFYRPENVELCTIRFLLWRRRYYYYYGYL